MADSSTDRVRRHRAHLDGDHSLCRPGCKSRLRVTAPGESAPAGALAAAVRDEFADSDPLLRALAGRLAGLAEDGRGTAAVQAARALGELVAATRQALR